MAPRMKLTFPLRTKYRGVEWMLVTEISIGFEVIMDGLEARIEWCKDRNQSFIFCASKELRGE